MSSDHECESPHALNELRIVIADLSIASPTNAQRVSLQRQQQQQQQQAAQESEYRHHICGRYSLSVEAVAMFATLLALLWLGLSIVYSQSDFPKLLMDVCTAQREVWPDSAC